MRNKILGSILILALVAAYIGYKMYNKPHIDIAKTKSALTISASELLKAFSEDEPKANESYLEKIFSVAGVVSSSKKEGDQIIVTLDCGDPLSGVICNLDPLSKHEKTEFAVGEKVVFKGTCSGYLSDVIMDRCVLEK